MLIWIPVMTVALLILFRHKLVEEWRFFSTRRREWLFHKWKDWGEPFVVAAVLAIVIRTFLLGPYKIPTGSMRPTFLEGDRIFVDKISYRFQEPERGDIIVFKYPLNKKKDYVKRLVGLPGDEIEIRNGKLIINQEVMDDPPFGRHYYYNRNDWDYGRAGETISIPADAYFVLGDNSAQSSDSRNWGFVQSDNLIGKTLCIWWPPKRIKLVK